MSNPVRESDTATRFQYSVGFSQSAFLIRHVKQRFLAYYNINSGVGQRHVHYIAFNDADGVLQSYKTRQLFRSFDPRWRQFNAGDIGTIAVSQVT